MDKEKFKNRALQEAYEQFSKRMRNEHHRDPGIAVLTAIIEGRGDGTGLSSGFFLGDGGYLGAIVDELLSDKTLGPIIRSKVMAREISKHKIKS